MATFFIIEQNTAGRVNLLFDGAPIILGHKYLVDEIGLLTFEKVDEDIRAVPLDSFKFSMEVDGVKSQNQSTATINYYTVAGEPTQQPESIITIEVNNTVNISDYMPYEPVFDRVVFTEVTGKGTFQLGSETLVAGNAYMYYELLDKLKFVSDAPGPKNEYAQLKYKPATADQVFDVENIITINVEGLAYLESDMTITTNIVGLYTVKEFTFQALSIPDLADIRILGTSAIANLALDADNKIVANIKDNLTEDVAGNLGISYMLTSDDNGYILVTVQVSMKSAFMPGDTVTFELSDINGSTSQIDLTKNILTFNL